MPQKLSEDVKAKIKDAYVAPRLAASVDPLPDLATTRVFGLPSLGVIARRFEVSIDTVFNIVHDYPGRPPTPKRRGPLTLEEQARILLWYERGEPHAAITARFGVSRDWVWRLAKRAGLEPRGRGRWKRRAGVV
ncbi:MAG TPA: helix-turn-helix domain-containing protein [Chloroflexota bacterium]|nr:helix-turn-helix domain-containing protein [Chloroflexota bacterium]